MSGFSFVIPGLGPTAPATTIPAGSIDHVSAALGRLCEQFKTKPNIVKLVTALAQPSQDLETALWDLFTKRTIYTAFGATLDALGNLVNQPRNGLSDADYQRFIAARVSANTSGGVPENLLAICRLVVNDPSVSFRYSNVGIAAYVIDAVLDPNGNGGVGGAVSDQVAGYVMQFLAKATAAGVRAIFHYTSSGVPTLVSGQTAFRFPTAVAFASSSLSIGATVIPVNSTAGFADQGKLDLEYGTIPVELNVAYTGRTATSFTGVTALAHNHVSGIAVQPSLTSVGPNAGFNTAAGGTTGGKFSSALST